jgi:hypothetical protein
MKRGFPASERPLTGGVGLPGFLLPGMVGGYGAGDSGAITAGSALPHSAQKDAALSAREAPQ